MSFWQVDRINVLKDLTIICIIIHTPRENALLII